MGGALSLLRPSHDYQNHIKMVLNTLLYFLPESHTRAGFDTANPYVFLRDPIPHCPG